jgi:hypothetical protein
MKKFFVALSLTLFAPGLARADSVSDFYAGSGKVIRFVIRTPPGGGYDLLSRLLARHMGRYIPGNPTLTPVNMPGGGGIVAANYMAHVAPKDGTILGAVSQGIPLQGTLGHPQARYAASKFNWLGRIAPSGNVTMVWHTSKAMSFDDALKQEIVLGATGAGSTVALYPSVMNEILKTKFKLVMGYKGSPEAMLAMGRQWRQQIGNRLVLLCASTREGEEALLLDAYMAATLDPRVLVIMVPRHPQRFNEVERMLEARGLRWQRRSQLTTENVPASTQILLGDTMGEMFAYYAACDVSFIGGSLLPLGGQNLIEALSCGKPVLVGPHTFNFKQVTADAITVGAAIRVPDAQHVFSSVSQLDAQSKDYQVMSDVAIQFCVQHQGATARTLKLLSPQLK